MRKYLWVLFAAILVTAACFLGSKAVYHHNQTGMRLDGVRIYKLSHPQYREAWDYVLECSGLTPQPGHGFEDVTWLSYAGVAFPDGTIAFWVPGDTIFVDSTYVLKKWVIRHELLHQLIQHQPGADKHPAVPFEEPCRLMYWQQP